MDAPVEVSERKLPDTKIVSVVSRFTLPDFSSRGPWLLEKLKPLWPQMNANNYTNHLAFYMNSNEFIFIKNDDAVALGMRQQKPFETAPYVEAIFGFVDDYKRNGPKLMQLYREMIRWGKTLGATEFRPGHISDIPHGRLKEMLNCDDYAEIILDI